MLFANGDGTFTVGPYDVLGIMQDTSTGRFHATLWLEAPMPGGDPPDTFVRLKSKFHHTTGADAFEGAVAHVIELRQKISISDDNVWLDLGRVHARDFANDGHAGMWVVENWKLAQPSKPTPEPESLSRLDRLLSDEQSPLT